jgi:hypothetical protein
VSETPPSHPQIDALLQTKLFQSILVTQFHHWEPPEEGGEEEEDNDDDSDVNDYGQEPQRHHPQQDQQQSNDPEFCVGQDFQDEDDEEESFDPPWPLEHEAFCAEPLVQEHVVLEIAAGLNSKGYTAQAMEVSKGNIKVVLPGSLRERGEFCLVDVAFMKDTSTATSNGTNAAKKAPSGTTTADNYRWMVRQTRFHCLSDFI